MEKWNKPYQIWLQWHLYFSMRMEKMEKTEKTDRFDTFRQTPCFFFRMEKMEKMEKTGA